jgi:hypothetical protein
MSFSGSTVLNFCLGSLPGCATISEAHWLVDQHPGGRSPSCRHCGPRCEVLSLDFRASLRESARFYDAIREQLGVQTLFSSDKSFKIYDRLAPGRDFSAIVLFKDPLYQLNSWKRTMDAAGRKEDNATFLRYYTRYYRELIEGDVRGKKIYLPTHLFQTKPGRALKAVCRAFDLTFDASAARYWERTHHSMGGNFHPTSRIKKDGISAVRIRDVRPAEFDPALVKLSESHEGSRAVYERMMALSIESMEAASL